MSLGKEGPPSGAELGDPVDGVCPGVLVAGQWWWTGRGGVLHVVFVLDVWQLNSNVKTVVDEEAEIKPADVFVSWRWRWSKGADKTASCPRFCVVSSWLDATQSSLVLKSGLNANWSKRYQTIITIRLMYTCSRPEENSIRPGSVCTVAPIQVNPQQSLFQPAARTKDFMSTRTRGVSTSAAWEWRAGTLTGDINNQ